MHESAGGSGRRASKPFPVSVSLRSYRGREAETVTSWVDDGTLGVSRATRELGARRVPGKKRRERSLPVRRASNFHCGLTGPHCHEPADILRVELVTQQCAQAIDAEMTQVVVEVLARRRQHDRFDPEAQHPQAEIPRGLLTAGSLSCAT